MANKLFAYNINSLHKILLLLTMLTLSKCIGLVGLEFHSPVNTIKVMLSWSAYLTTLFLDTLSPLSG